MKVEEFKVRVSNRDEESRAYTIEGTVRQNGTSSTIESGDIHDNHGSYLGDFSNGSADQLNINYQTGDNRTAILEAVEDFIDRAKTYAADSMPQ